MLIQISCLIILLSVNMFQTNAFENNTLIRIKRNVVQLAPYNYRLTGMYGQNNWATYFPQCNGKKQSPININLKTVMTAKYPSTLRTTNIDTKPLEIEMRNNGYTVYIKYSWGCCEPKIYGGPLKHVYIFKSLHFHWGVNNSVGAEHLIDGLSAALESHMIFQNSKYKTEEEALKYPDGLAVFGTRYFCSPMGRKFKLFEGIKRIPKWGDTAKAFYPITSALSDLIGNPNFHYVHYEGSLTTPPCSESVQWLVNINTVPMNCNQMAYFRELKNEQGFPVSGNYREVQPVNGRPVLVS